MEDYQWKMDMRDIDHAFSGGNETRLIHAEDESPFLLLLGSTSFLIDNRNHIIYEFSDTAEVSFSMRPPTVNIKTCLGLALQAAWNKTAIKCHFIPEDLHSALECKHENM